MFYAALQVIEEPQTYTEAITSNDCQEWMKAMQEEYNSLIENKTWDIVRRLTDKLVLPVKWVYKVKQRSDRSID